MPKDFTIVFEKLKEQQPEFRWKDPENPGGFEVIIRHLCVAELDQLSEIRRLVIEAMEVEPTSFTTT